MITAPVGLFTLFPQPLHFGELLFAEAFDHRRICERRVDVLHQEGTGARKSRTRQRK